MSYEESPDKSAFDYDWSQAVTHLTAETNFWTGVKSMNNKHKGIMFKGKLVFPAPGEQQALNGIDHSLRLARFARDA